jgi:signal peptidase II
VTQTAETVDAPARGSVAPAIRRNLFWAAAAIVIGLDQATKAIVRASLERGEDWPDGWPVHFTYITNTGAAFGILKDQSAFIAIMAGVGLVAIYLYYRNPPFQHWIASVAVGMMLGGAAGNLLDRIFRERVTDFIKFPEWPAFNVADSSISVGVAIIIIGYLLFGEQPRERPHEDAPPDG